MIFNFIYQLNTCVCLSDGFDDNKGQLPASNCSFICDNCTLLTNECGGVSAYNVFYTGGNNNDTSIWKKTNVDEYIFFNTVVYNDKNGLK